MLKRRVYVISSLALPGLIILILTSQTSAQTGSPGTPSVIIDRDFSSVQLGRYIDVLVDRKGELTFKEVSSLSMAGEFKRHNEESFSYGFGTSPNWYRFKLIQDTGDSEPPRLLLAVTRVITTELDLFVPVIVKGGSAYHHFRSNFNNGRDPNDMGYRFPVLTLPRNIKDGAYVYLRVRTKTASYAVTLYSEKAFYRYTWFEYLFFGLVAGVMLAMFLYNLMLAIVLREKVYAAYCIYIGCINCHFALFSGWPLGLGLDPEFITGLVLQFFAATFFFGLVFSRMFLNTGKNYPVIDLIFKFLMVPPVVNFVLVLAGFWNFANAMSYIIGLIEPGVILVSSLIIWRRGYRAARYYVIAWFVLIVSGIIHSATGPGLVAYTFLTNNLFGIGAALESVLLSFALADRIKILKNERAFLREQERHLKELSITDELTGLYNKRWFSSKLISEIEHADRLGSRLSLIIMDADHFKKFNDTHGHAAGDRMLALLGKVISAAFRASDIACRYGGEEFAVILPGIDQHTAEGIADRFLAHVVSQKITVQGFGKVGVTISIGVAEMNSDDTAESLFERADRALYQAKSLGRNRVESL